MEPILLWDVTATLLEPMLGTVAKDKEVFTNFIEKKKADRVDAINDSEVETIPPEVNEKSGVTGYHQDENGLFVYDYLVKGALKNAGNTLKDALKEKALKSKINNFFFVYPRRVYIIGEDGLPVKTPDGPALERPLMAFTPQGPRVTLAKSDQVAAGRRLKFQVKVVAGCPLRDPAKILHECMEYWKDLGLGQWRNGGYGRAACEHAPTK